jgi:hypothetical protein
VYINVLVPGDFRYQLYQLTPVAVTDYGTDPHRPSVLFLLRIYGCKTVLTAFSGGKRKASEEPSTPESKQRSKKARTDSPERYTQVRPLLQRGKFSRLTNCSGRGSPEAAPKAHSLSRKSNCLHPYLLKPPGHMLINTHNSPQFWKNAPAI